MSRETKDVPLTERQISYLIDTMKSDIRQAQTGLDQLLEFQRQTGKQEPFDYLVGIQSERIEFSMGILAVLTGEAHREIGNKREAV